MILFKVIFKEKKINIKMNTNNYLLCFNYNDLSFILKKEYASGIIKFI